MVDTFQGLSEGLFGPTLLDLESQTHIATDTISYIMAAAAVTDLIGSALGGPLAEKINNWTLVSVALFFRAAANFWIPWTNSISQFVAAWLFNEFFYGLYDPCMFRFGVFYSKDHY